MQPDALAHELPAPPSILTVGFKLTDSGNAERFVARYRYHVRYCQPRKRWLLWDGQRWAWDQRSEIEQLAKLTVRAIYAEAEHARDADEADAIAKHAHQSEKRERRAALVALAQSERGVPVLPSELDADPWLFNASNGTIDLRTGQLREHRREDLITKLSPVAYRSGAQHDLWNRVLADFTGGDSELAEYLQRAVGYALQGQVTEKKFWFLFGPPDGGKSTFIDAVSNVLGDYGASAAFSTWLVQSNTGGNRGDLVALLGTRLVCSVEVRRGVKFDEAIMKQVTGGDAIKAAAKYEAEIEFAPSFALWLAANDAPAIRDDDEGFWSRVQRVPFTNAIPREHRDPRMREKLRAPEVQQAILAWAVEGCLLWQIHGIGTCAAVANSTEAYRHEMDRVAGFFTHHCEFNSQARVATPTLREAYESWCRENGQRTPLNGKELALRLEARGCTKGKSGSTRWWNGVRLVAEGGEP